MGERLSQLNESMEVVGRVRSRKFGVRLSQLNESMNYPEVMTRGEEEYSR